LQNYVEGDKVVDLHIGGSGESKYAIMTVDRNGKSLLFSKRFSEVILKGRGRLEGAEDKFYLLAN